MAEIIRNEVTFDEIRLAIKEITESQKETAQQFKEIAQQSKKTDLQIKELAEQSKKTTQQIKKTDLQIKELAEQSEKTDLQIKGLAEQSEKTDQQFKKTNKQIKELAEQSEKTDQQFKKTNEQIKELRNLFTNQWGRLMESLVEGDLVKLLNERGIKVKKNEEREEGAWQDKEYEFDIFSIGDNVIVVTEVKTTLRKGDVDHFLYKLKYFRRMFPEHADKTIHAAMAYLRVGKGVDTYAARKGFLVIRATGSSASITNEKTFRPSIF